MGQSTSSQRTSRANSFQSKSSVPAVSHYGGGVGNGERERTSSFFLASGMTSSNTNNNNNNNNINNANVSNDNRASPEMEDYYEYMEDTEDSRALKAHVNSASTSVTLPNNRNPLVANPHAATKPPPFPGKPSASAPAAGPPATSKKSQSPTKNGKPKTSRPNSGATPSTGKRAPPAFSSVTRQVSTDFPPAPYNKRKSDSQPPQRLSASAPTPPTAAASSFSRPYHYENGTDDEELFMLVLPGSATPRASSGYLRRTTPLGGSGDQLNASGDDESWSVFSETDLGAGDAKDGSPKTPSPAMGLQSFTVDKAFSPKQLPKAPLGNSILMTSFRDGGHSPLGGANLPLPPHRGSKEGGGGHRTSTVAFSGTVVVEPKKSRRGSASRSSITSGSASGKRPIPQFHKLQPISSTYELGRKLSSSSSFVTSSITMEGVAAEEAKVYELLFNKMDRATGRAAPPPLPLPMPVDSKTGQPLPASSPIRQISKPKVSRNYQNPDNISPEALANFVQKGATPMPQPDPNGPITNVYHEGEVKILLTSFLGFDFAQCKRVTTPVGMDLDIHSDEEEEAVNGSKEGRSDTAPS